MSAMSTADLKPQASQVPASTELKTSIRPLAQPTAPQQDVIDIYYSQTMGIEYVFLCAEDQPEQQECVRIATQMMTTHELSPNRCMFLIATGSHRQRQFHQCLIRWVGNHPVEVTCTEVSSPSQLQHYQTILGHGRLVTQ